jgi:hypothetical protein
MAQRCCPAGAGNRSYGPAMLLAELAEKLPGLPT